MKNILIQEADASIRELLYIYFTEEKFKVQVVPMVECDLISVLSSASKKPDVVLLDFVINGEQSIKTCKSIKEIYPHIPVFAMSTQDQLAKDYCSHGFDGFISKPFDFKHLSKLILNTI